MREIKSDNLSPRTDSGTTTLGDSGDTFLVNTGAKLDINGTELILDADADTSITADTDDQIDIRIAGDDDFRFTANNMNVLSGSTLTIDSGATITNSGTATGFVGTKLEASSDTSAGDNAAMGYTASEGLILTGQGSTNDITIKNDADQDVMTVPTGGTAVTFAGNVTVNGLIFDHETLDIYDEGTWTPILRPYTTVFDSITYDSLRIGKYVIIGNLCYFSFTMRTDAITAGSGSGAMNIFGFPFTPAQNDNHYKAFFMKAIDGNSFAGENPTELQMHVGAFAGLYYNADGTTAGSSTLIADMDTGADKNWMACQGMYETT